MISVFSKGFVMFLWCIDFLLLSWIQVHRPQVVIFVIKSVNLWDRASLAASLMFPVSTVCKAKLISYWLPTTELKS